MRRRGNEEGKRGQGRYIGRVRLLGNGFSCPEGQCRLTNLSSSSQPSRFSAMPYTDPTSRDLTHLFTLFSSFRRKLLQRFFHTTLSRSHGSRPLTSLYNSCSYIQFLSLSYISQFNKGRHQSLFRYCRQYSCTISCAIDSKCRYCRRSAVLDRNTTASTISISLHP